MRVAVRVDASPLIGGGHAMRCLTLADELAARGAEITFVSAAMPDALAKRIEAAGHKLVRIAAPAGLERDRSDWHEPPLNPDVQAADARAAGAAAGAVDWLIVDHYLLDVHWHRAARSFADRLLVIDDLANRSYDCDVLVDETGGRSSTDYDGRVPDQAKVLVGAQFALLRPEFAKERSAALERRREAKRAELILISLGTTDPNGVTAAALEAVLVAASDCSIHVVLGEDATSLPRTITAAGENRRVEVHVNTNRMAELMRDADVAIGAAGTTSWERCCLGLPAIALVLAENQRANAEALELAGAAIMVKNVGEIHDTVARLVSDEQALQSMSAAAFGLTDGLGTVRVLDAMLAAPAQTAAVRA
ncbi:MAG TPA: UDP-2,4-diacetamido-2,4,6-trideoxy-beta-L-altropyranose hydrolase [Sphingomicrobium sp.]|nr:UDP-2,4-diacetamido-2,4,6-trideoxy-beta-L-altropyranose hydrolase [Sphingomicrobium sp.]